MSYTIRPLDDPDLPAVAAFRVRFEDDSDASEANLLTKEQRLAKLEWRLAGNPARRADLPLGHGLFDETGRLHGINLVFPWRYRGDGRTWVGLGAGGLFVDSSARMQGFLLFRRFLGIEPVDFHYATTCNAVSGGLWSRSKGVAVPGTDREYILPLRPGPIVQEAALRRGLSPALSAIARFVSAGAGPFLRRRPRHGTRLKLMPATDWTRLAEISLGNADDRWLIADRTEAYMAWTYARSPLAREGSMHVYRFDAGPRREGWLSVSSSRRGRLLQIRTATLQDWSIPAGVDFADVLRSAARLETVRRSDMLAFYGRPDLQVPAGSWGFRPRALPSPNGYVVDGADAGTSLARRLVIAAADRF